MDNYRRILTIIGEIGGDMIAPNAEQVDREGNTLNEDGTVTLHPLVRQNLERLTQGDLMGFTLPRKYGGLNCPSLIYTMANEIVSRADCSLMNLFGLQGIAETIYAFANDEIKDEYLPQFCPRQSDRRHGAHRARRRQRPAGRAAAGLPGRAGQLALNGVKRFITNGCGEVLLVLARSEPEIGDGRGLSLFVAERGRRVRVRHLEEKLGIHGSPTCELVFDDTPCRLIGERQRGLITYVMSLMNGARVGIAAQSLGVGEAAFRLARTYAHTRRQFGVPDRAAAGRGRAGHRHEDRRRGRPGAGLRDQPRLRPREQQRPRAGVGRPAGEGRRETPQAVGPLAEADERHAHADEQVLLLGDVGPRGAQRHPGAGRLRLHEGLRGRALSSAIRGSPRSTKAPASCRSWRPCGGVTSGAFETWTDEWDDEGIRRSALDRAEGEAPGRQAADPGGHPVRQVAADLLHGPGRPAAGRCGDRGDHRPSAAGPGARPTRARSASPGGSSTARCPSCG